MTPQLCAVLFLPKLPKEAQLAAVLALLAAAIVMFAVNRPRMDAVALLMLVALPFTGTVTVPQALAGFADPNIVLIAALFVLGDGLVRTGVAQRLGDWLIARAGPGEVRLMALLMLIACALGAVMSSTAVTAIFIPVVLRICQATGAAPGRLLMPLCFGALISGMTTLIATAPNLVVSGELERAGHAPFSFFAFTPFGVPVLLLGIAYMAFARRWLPDRQDPDASAAGPSLAGWVAEYGLAARERRYRVTEGSPLAGRPLVELHLPRTYGARVVAVERGRDLFSPDARTELVPGDTLLVDLPAPVPGEQDATALKAKLGLEPLPLTGAYFTDRSQDLGMAEVILPASSDLLGKTVADIGFRSRYGVTVLGLRRGPEASAPDPAHTPLQLGDTLLLIGPWKAIDNLRAGGRDLVLLDLPAERRDVLPVPGKAWQALACLGLVVALMVSGLVPNAQAALLGCLLLGLFGCTDLNTAYRAVDWKTLVLIVGMLPFSTALQNTGGVDLAAGGLMSLLGGAGPRVVLACIFALTAVLGMFISNTATAVLMAPVAIALAKNFGASPYPFAMTVALAASTAFMTPVSSSVNTLVVTPGRYTFGDFLKVGVPLSLVVLVVCVFLVPIVLPF